VLSRDDDKENDDLLADGGKNKEHSAVHKRSSQVSATFSLRLFSKSGNKGGGLAANEPIRGKTQSSTTSSATHIKPPIAEVSMEIPHRALAVLLRQLFDLDTYSHKQQELRDILQVLSKITPRSSILISEEASKLCGIALENAVTYMNSIHSLINSRDAEPLNRAFDESVFYHMLSQVHLMRPWDVGACDFCRISNKRLSVLYQSMKTYLASMSWLISIEESLIEEPGNRRFMRSRHFTRSAYIVDCVRVASLQNVQNTVSFTYGPDHRRFLQSYVTQEFRDLVAPFSAFLNRLIVTHPSTCDQAGPMHWMLKADTAAHYLVPAPGLTTFDTRESFSMHVSITEKNV
jgi:hypothetical protein